MAVLVAIRIAAAMLGDGEFPDDVAALPPHPDDNDWESATDALTDDRNAEAYYDPDTVPAWLRIHPIDTWFTPHDGATPRDPDRGYRR